MTETTKQPADYRLPRSVLRWVAVGLVLTTAVVIVISVFSGVTLSDLARLGYLPFGLAAAASIGRLLVQIVRFRVIASSLAGEPKIDLGGLPIVRMSSEFIAMSTPSEVGGPVLRAAWLSGKGVDSGKAMWIGYFEVLMEIYVGAALGLVAAAYALLKGATVLGLTIGAIATVLIVGYTLVFIVPAVKSIKVPHRVFSIAAFLLGGPRATSLYLRAVVGSLNFSVAAHAIMNRESLPLLAKSIGLTILEDLLEGAALWIVLNAAGLRIDFFSATIVAFAALTIASIPISIGGAGVTELSMQSYLLLVYGFSSWAAIVLWRVATFQVVLAVSGLAFLLLVRKSKGPSKMDLIRSEEPSPRTSDGRSASPDSGRFGPRVTELSSDETRR
jgi:glycosyltransferase 2 family protein